MSELPADYADRLNLREQLARIDHTLDEAAKFRAETATIGRDRVLAPFTLVVASIGAGAALFAAAQAFFRAGGHS